LEKKRAEEVLSRSRQWGSRNGEVTQTMYTHICKCKIDKTKEKKTHKK
jgi:hypothetical protein